MIGNYNLKSILNIHQNKQENFWRQKFDVYKVAILFSKSKPLKYFCSMLTQELDKDCICYQTDQKYFEKKTW